MLKCGLCDKKIKKAYAYVDDGMQPPYPICKDCHLEYYNDFDELL